MKRNYRFILGIFIVFFLFHVKNSSSEISEALKPGTSTGQLTVNNQTFNIKHAYVKKTKAEKDEIAFLVLLTNRPFPEDLSTLNRIDLNKRAQRYDLQGVVIGLDKNQSLSFTDILRLRTITAAVKFDSSTNESGSIEGRLYTNGEKQFLNDKFEIDITFSAKP
jgi:hypothetical protein